ncbi:hypothetical protein DXH95_00400 [Sphingorhabdus pulchriflava]|uniref:Uncharacterized protein n=1 Tax=Sphingorhabdus pulchriflava TaxID=2292257 RepID=A0A371BEE2_9SPHN|nr:hypothetical protein [Sphingorhabdus pulchriflava]RDV05954.1 hypothetical protein DXH95_00400 [Sphingorhabdus pulchriflava]
MLSIHEDASLQKALQLPLPEPLRMLLQDRRAMLGYDLPLRDMAQFVVVQAGDTLADVERETGLHIQLTMDDPDYTPAWEWVIDHGLFYETVFILSDDGYGIALFALKAGIDPILRRLLENGLRP